MTKQPLHIGAVAFIHRFGASLNAHGRFHVSFEAKEMLGYKHSGFSVHTSVRSLITSGCEQSYQTLHQRGGPPMWDDCGTQMGEGAQVEPDWDLAAQPAPHYEVNQRINWRVIETAIHAAFQTRCGGGLCARHTSRRFDHNEPETCTLFNAQVARINDHRWPQTRALLNLMRLNFLSVRFRGVRLRTSNAMACGIAKSLMHLTSKRCHRNSKSGKLSAQQTVSHS